MTVLVECSASNVIGGMLFSVLFFDKVLRAYSNACLKNTTRHFQDVNYGVEGL